MKRKVLWLIMTLTVFTAVADAQIRRGYWVLGMNVRSSFEWQSIVNEGVTYKNNNATQSWSISPGFGYVVK